MSSTTGEKCDKCGGIGVGKIRGNSRLLTSYDDCPQCGGTGKQLSDVEMLLFLNGKLLIVASMALALAKGTINDEEYELNLIEQLDNIYSRISAEQTARIEAALGAVTFDNIRPGLDREYSDDSLRAVLIRARKLMRNALEG